MADGIITIQARGGIIETVNPAAVRMFGYTAKDLDGSCFPMEMAVREMWLGGQRYFTDILRDISARKQAESNPA